MLISSFRKYKLFFYLSNIVAGAGGTALYTLGPATIDEITTRRKGSICKALFFTGMIKLASSKDGCHDGVFIIL